MCEVQEVLPAQCAARLCSWGLHAAIIVKGCGAVEQNSELLRALGWIEVPASCRDVTRVLYLSFQARV